MSLPACRFLTMIMLMSPVVVALLCGCDSGKSSVSPAPAPAPKPMPVQATAPTNREDVADNATPDVLPRFVEVAADAGIDFVFDSDTQPDRYFLPEVMGGGAAWLDFDRDNRRDLYLMNGGPLDASDSAISPSHNALYRAIDVGQFVPLPEESGADDAGYGQGCAVGDFNADGFADIYLGNFGANVLLLNNGDGTWSDVSQTAAVADPLWTSSVVWFDVDDDHDLDLYVTNYLDVTRENLKVCEYNGRPGYCGPGQYESVPDHLYLNQGDGTFVEAAEQFGFVDEIGKGLAIVVTDFDRDFTPEVYVANDMTPNFLFARQTKPGEPLRYGDIAQVAGCAQSGEGMNEASMGIACADFDGDDNYDLYLTHYFQMKNTLYRNIGNLLFDDVSLRIGAAKTSYQSLGFGTAPFDFDRDGWDDLFITNGHVLGPLNEPNEMTAQLLWNVGGRKFEDISELAGPYFEQRWLGRGVAAGDYDDDGDIDLAVTHLDAPVALLRNDSQFHNDTQFRNDTTPGGHYLGVELATKWRMSPIGARVRVTTAQGVRERAQLVGGSYLCSPDERLLFGWTGDDSSVDVEVAWPSGSVETFSGLAVDRYWRLAEGAGSR